MNVEWGRSKRTVERIARKQGNELVVANHKVVGIFVARRIGHARRLLISLPPGQSLILLSNMGRHSRTLRKSSKSWESPPGVDNPTASAVVIYAKSLDGFYALWKKRRIWKR